MVSFGNTALLYGAVLLLSPPALAQSGQPIAQPTAVVTPISPAALVVGAPVAMVLRQGTEVRFKTSQGLSSQASKDGDRFELTTIDPVYVGSLLVIPAGSRGVGEVAHAAKKGAFGASGKLDTRVLYVVVGDQRISMAGKAHEQGSSGTVGVVAAAVLFWPVMPFITGKSAILPSGTDMTGYVENDLPIAVASTPTAAPLMVQSAPTPVAAATVAAAPAALPVSAGQPKVTTVTAMVPATSPAAAPKPVSPSK